MRVATINGTLYYGDVYFGTEFIRVVPNRILTYDTEKSGYVELENIPSEIFVPIVRIEAIVELPPVATEEGEPVVATEEELQTEDEEIVAEDNSFEEERQ